MATITTRVGKGSALTTAEVDANFTNLNTELLGKAAALGYTPANKAGDTFTGNVLVNTGADSRVLLQSSGTTQAQFQVTATAVRLASNNALPLYISQNGVDLLDITTTALVGNRHFRVPNSASYNYAFVGEQTSGAGKYNLYMSGTAANYLGGALDVAGAVTQGGSQVLHAANYSSYAPTLTGTGASGSWGISVTGSAGSVAWSGVTGKPTTLAGYGITDAQALDADLTAIAALAGTTGLLKKTAANTWTLDTATYLTGITSGQVTTALGFTPYDATNPSGYITSSALSPYLPLAGGTVTGALVVTDTLFSIKDDADATKIALFNLAGLTTGTTYTYSLPALTGTLATIGSLAQTFSGTTAFSSGVTMSNAVTMSTATGATNIGTSNTTGVLTVGGAAGTGIITLGRSTGTQVTNIQAGATASAATKTLSIGTGGLTGSTTAISIGSTFGTTVTANGTWTFGSTISGNAATATSASAVSGLTLNSVASPTNPDSVTQNQLGYCNTVSLFAQQDGGLYSSSYDSTWIHQIYGDFRSGQIAVRGKLSGTWQAWRTVLDSGNYNSYALPLSGGTVSGIVRINNKLQAGSNTNGTAYIDAYGGYAYYGADNYSTGMRIDSSGNANFSGALTQGGNQVLHAGNYSSYSPTLTGGSASGTWGISVTGSSRYLSFNDGPRDLTDRSPSWSARSVAFDFVGAGTGNGAGNYAGVMTFAPWTGTSASTGDSSYQLAFANNSGVNASGQPKLSIRNGIDSTWNAWHVMLHSGNYTDYATARTSAGRPGVYKLYRNESDDAYNVQTTWGADASGYWSLRGYYNDSFHAPCYVALSGVAQRANRANGNFYIDENYGNTVVGVYNAARYQGVFAMGDAYKLPADGTTTGGLYGMAWSHPNAGGAAGNLTDHGLLIINNGVFKCAISNSIVASGNVTAYSDERLKTNWRDMPEDFVARLAQVKVGIYDRTDGEQYAQVGVGAQSLQKLLPQAITTATDEMGTLSVNYGAAALASAVELAKDNVDLRARVAKLEALVSKLIEG